MVSALASISKPVCVRRRLFTSASLCFSLLFRQLALFPIWRPDGLVWELWVSHLLVWIRWVGNSRLPIVGLGFNRELWVSLVLVRTWHVNTSKFDALMFLDFPWKVALKFQALACFGRFWFPLKHPCSGSRPRFWPFSSRTLKLRKVPLLAFFRDLPNYFNGSVHRTGVRPCPVTGATGPPHVGSHAWRWLRAVSSLVSLVTCFHRVMRCN